MIILKIILLPFSLVYEFLIYLRNKCYESGIFKKEKISVPVISIGNITTGGTGKTPFTVFLSEYFLKIGKKVGVVSRGYGRKSDETIIVCDGVNINDDTDQSGDELILISNELVKKYRGRFFSAAGSNRSVTSNLLISKFNPDIIILDDAFQNRKIDRDLDIVMVDSADLIQNKFRNKFTLPSGNLRESFSNLKRAGIVIQNNKSSEMKLLPELREFAGKTTGIEYKTEYFIDFKNSILEERDKPAILFSGIANNDSFISMVKKTGINVSEIIKFPDHHNYSGNDIAMLKKKNSGEKIFITTEKDFIKIKKFKEFTEDFSVYFLKINIEVTANGKLLFDKLDSLIK